MLQKGSLINVLDNTGAKTAKCLRVESGFRRRYAFFGNIILVSIKSLRIKRRESIKVKKGEIYSAIVLQTKIPKILFNGDFVVCFNKAAIVLLNKNKKILGTRIFGSISKKFRFTKYLKLLTLGTGFSSF
jgi:large subunit ribosomal protein L14